MKIAQDIQEKLSKVIQNLPAAEEDRQRWQDGIKSEDCPPGVIVEILATMKSVEDIEGIAENDATGKGIETFFAKQMQNLDKHDKEISQQSDEVALKSERVEKELNDLYKEVKELEQEFGAKGESHLEENINDQETHSTHEYTRSGQTAQSQHLRVQQPIDSSTPEPVVAPESSDGDTDNDDDKNNKEETHNNPPQPTGYY